MKFQNPKGVKNLSDEHIVKHTFTCLRCGEVFVDLNNNDRKFCSHGCSVKYRMENGWKPLKETIEASIAAHKGRKWTEGQRELCDKYGKVLTAEWFDENYFKAGRTIAECARLVGCSDGTITRYMRNLGLVGKRAFRDSVLLKKPNNTREYLDKDWLYQKYIVERKSTHEIAKLCGAGVTTIKRWVRKHGIPFRTLSENASKPRSLASRDKQSKHLSDKYAGIGWGPTNKYKYIGKDNKEYILDSTWELEMVRFLENNNVKFLVHKEIAPLAYKIRGYTIHRYHPDFYLPGEDKYIEVKGRFTERAKEKMDKVLSQNNINLQILMFKDLVSMGVLSKDHDKIVSSGFYNEYKV